MPTTKINNKNRGKQSGGAQPTRPIHSIPTAMATPLTPNDMAAMDPKNRQMFDKVVEILAKIGVPVANKSEPVFNRLFQGLSFISKYSDYISMIIKYPSYCINSFGAIIVLFIVIFMILAPIVMFIREVVDRPDLANKLSAGIHRVMTIIPSDVLYIIISVLKTILGILLIIVFCISGDSILETFKNSPSLMSAFVVLLINNMYILHGILGILFTIGLFLGFYNLTCMKELPAKRYSGNVGDFLTLPIMIFTIIFALFGLVIKQSYKSKRFSAMKPAEFLYNVSKTVIFFSLFGFLYLFILICNYISNIVGDATAKFMDILAGGTTCTGIDDDCDKMDESIKCSFEASEGSDKQDSELVKRLKGMLTTLFMFFIMIVVVISSPADNTLKIISMTNKLVRNVSTRVAGAMEKVLSNPSQ